MSNKLKADILKSLKGPRPASRVSSTNKKDAALSAYLKCDASEDATEIDTLSWFARWKQGDFTIVPEGNIFISVWDLLVVSALLAMAVILPFDAAIQLEPSFESIVLDRLCDCIFVSDIFITFNVAYDVTNSANNDLFERAPLKIAGYYMAFPFSDHGKAGWFWLDTLTVVPWDQFNNGSGFRLVRVLRLLRLFRLFRLIKLFRKWHTRFGYPIALLNVISCGFSTLMTCHWFACIWGHLAVTGEQYGTTWLQQWLNHHQNGKLVSECTPMEVYNVGLYWSVTTLTSVGYGDVEPQNQFEVVLTSITMLVLGIQWAWVLAHLVSYISDSDAFATESSQLTDSLNLLMEHRGLSPALRHSCRRHLFESFHVHRQRYQQRTVKWLSAGLQGEIAIESGVDSACYCVWYLRDSQKSVLVAIAQLFVGDMFSPNEYIHDRYSLFVLRKGICVKRSKLLMRDSVIGADMILASDDLVDTVAPKTVTFVEVMALSRTDLVSVCESHFELDVRVRKAQVKLALWRAIIVEARAKKRGRISVLMQKASAQGSSVKDSRPTFAESIGPVQGPHAVSLQEGISDAMEQVGSLMRRVEDTRSGLLSEFAALNTRIDELSEPADAEKRRNFKVALCGRLKVAP